LQYGPNYKWDVCQSILLFIYKHGNWQTLFTCLYMEIKLKFQMHWLFDRYSQEFFLGGQLVLWILIKFIECTLDHPPKCWNSDSQVPWPAQKEQLSSIRADELFISMCWLSPPSPCNNYLVLDFVNALVVDCSLI